MPRASATTRRPSRPPNSHDPGSGAHKHAESEDVDGWRDWRSLANGDTLDKRTSPEVPLTPPHSHWIQRCGKAHISHDFFRRAPVL